MIRRLAAALALLTAFALATPAHAADEGPEQIVNGTFDEGTGPWWGTGNLTLGVDDGRMCVDVPGGTANPWDVIIGQDNLPLVEGETYAFSFYASATPAKVGRALVQLPVDPWTQYLSAAPEMSVSGNVYRYTFTAPRLAAERPGRLPDGRQRRALEVLHGRRVAAGRRGARGVRA
ncbi:carbohydrate binding domain-containing protein [Nonomuraea ferruginea]